MDKKRARERDKKDRERETRKTEKERQESQRKRHKKDRERERRQKLERDIYRDREREALTQINAHKKRCLCSDRKGKKKRWRKGRSLLLRKRVKDNVEKSRLSSQRFRDMREEEK